jgi:hypothetical protein
MCEICNQIPCKMYEAYQAPPKREFHWRRDFWFPIYFFFWHNTWWFRRLYCKHNGVHFSDSSKGPHTMCATCYSKDVPQCCGQRA